MQSFLDDFNGRSFFLSDIWLDSFSLNLYTDAAASLGYGAVFGNEWCFGAWPDNWKQLNITILEFYPIVLSVLLWGDKMRNQRITFFTATTKKRYSDTTIQRYNDTRSRSRSWSHA